MSVTFKAMTPCYVYHSYSSALHGQLEAPVNTNLRWLLAVLFIERFQLWDGSGSNPNPILHT